MGGQERKKEGGKKKDEKKRGGQKEARHAVEAQQLGFEKNCMSTHGLFYRKSLLYCAAGYE